MGDIAEISRRYVLQTTLGLLTLSTLLVASSPHQPPLEVGSAQGPVFTDVRFVTLDFNSEPNHGVKIFYVLARKDGTLFN